MVGALGGSFGGVGHDRRRPACQSGGGSRGRIRCSSDGEQRWRARYRAQFRLGCSGPLRPAKRGGRRRHLGLQRGFGCTGDPSRTATLAGQSRHPSDPPRIIPSEAITARAINGIAISASSRDKHAIVGSSVSKHGVQGKSENGAGVYAVSTNGDGLVARHRTGPGWAGRFHGDVLIQELHAQRAPEHAARADRRPSSALPARQRVREERAMCPVRERPRPDPRHGALQVRRSAARDPGTISPSRAGR